MIVNDVCSAFGYLPQPGARREYLPEIAWETKVRVANAPDLLIHFNGERFPRTVRRVSAVLARAAGPGWDRPTSTVAARRDSTFQLVPGPNILRLGRP